MSSTSGHAFVLGSGIAGLSIAEILSRNGWRITLVESSTELGGDASRSTQNWLHTGWLYAALPYSSAMRGCAESLRLFESIYLPVLPRDVVNVHVAPRRVDYAPSLTGWFAPDRVHYAFAIGTNDLNVLQKATWNAYLDQVPLRRLRSLGYPIEAATQLPAAFVELLNRWEGHDAGHSKYRVIPSTDARIDTKRVLSSLLAMLGEGTQVVTGASYSLERDGSRTVVNLAGERHKPDLCVIAAGKSIPELLAQIGAENVGRNFKSVCSPIVVLGRALDLPNFIRFTPNLPHTVNHMKYVVDGRNVSTIGSYDYHAPDQRPDIEPFVQKVCARLGVSTTDAIGSYYGTKTELTGSLDRRYNHALDSVNDNTFFAAAGKFSQFPLLVKELADKLGLRTDIGNDARGVLSMTVAATAPERLVRDARRRGAPPHAA